MQPPDLTFRTPGNLQISDTPVRRILLIGSCLAQRWHGVFTQLGVQNDFILNNYLGGLPLVPPLGIDAYDFQIVQLNRRTILPEKSYLRIASGDETSYRTLFDHSAEMLGHMIKAAMALNEAHGILTFFCNFLLPQQSPMGRLLPRYRYENLVYFIEELNRVLHEELSRYHNAYVLDIDQIAATHGRAHIQDDVAWVTSHGTSLWNGDFEHDQNRIEPVSPVTSTYSLYGEEIFYSLTLMEILAMYRTIRQIDMVKLIIIDLDDTLWRGVGVEQAENNREGWPLGFIEALVFAKKRGIVLAIASKNDEDKILKIWDERVGDLLPLSDFVTHRINWKPKVENIDEILADVNLLPKNVLYIDDNPVERAAVKDAFPAMRVLGGNPYLWRRILLWSAETQVANVSRESQIRTDMVRAQVVREGERRRLSREEFLQTLNLSLRLEPIRSIEDPKFARALELINKSNQFNTTGVRWPAEACAAFFAAGGVFWVFTVEDRFAKYGLVGVVIAHANHLRQFVMSCRVVGLGVERAVLATMDRLMKDAAHVFIQADFVATEANGMCSELYAASGYESQMGGWFRSLASVSEVPPHVSVTVVE